MQKPILFCLTIFLLLNLCAPLMSEDKKPEFSVGVILNPGIISIDRKGQTSAQNWGDYFNGSTRALFTYTGVEALWRFGKGNWPLIVGVSVGTSRVGLMTVGLVGTEYDFFDTPATRLGVRGLVHGGVDYYLGLNFDLGLRTDLLWKIKLNAKNGIDLAAGLQVRTSNMPLDVRVPLTVAFSFM